MSQREINLGDDFGPVTIRVNGATFNITDEGILESKIAIPKPENKYDIGAHIEGKGIYIGFWQPKDEKGQSLNRIFDLYAAPEDLKPGPGKKNYRFTFQKAAQYVAGLESWHGHNGTLISSEKDLIDRIKSDPESLKNWFIPPKNVLCDHIYKNAHKFPKGSGFVTSAWFRKWYWSCSRPKTKPRNVWGINFSNGSRENDKDTSASISTRAARAELRKPAFMPNVMK